MTISRGSAKTMDAVADFLTVDVLIRASTSEPALTMHH